MKPKVTIGICVRNCESTVKETINSIMDQDFPHNLMEVIFVDDGSEDGTLQIISDYVSRMPMSKKILHDEWKGLGPARNSVVNNAGGKYILWVDGDMTLPKNHVRKQVEFMDKHPRVGIAKARYGMPPGENTVAFLENIIFVLYDCREVSLNEKLPGTGGSIYRVDVIRGLDGFDQDMRGVGEDQDAAYRVKAADWLLERSPTVFFEKRVDTWRKLWNKYFWYGYGNYDLFRKNRSIFTPYKMNPIAGFVAGALHASDALRLTHRKSVFLLPFHFAFKMTAWCLGFARRAHNFSSQTDVKTT